MQITGEELIRASVSVGTRHSGEASGTVEASEMTGSEHGGNGRGSDRAAWVRVARNGGITTAPNRPRANALAPIIGSDPISSGTRSEIDRVVHHSNATPDTREGIVASLRERIESGTYFVSAETIAEMMIRRTVADQLR